MEVGVDARLNSRTEKTIAKWRSILLTTPSVRNYLSSKWMKMDVSRTKIHLDTSISMTSISGRREYKIRLHEVALPLTIEEEKYVTLDHPIERG